MPVVVIELPGRGQHFSQHLIFDANRVKGPVCFSRRDVKTKSCSQNLFALKPVLDRIKIIAKYVCICLIPNIYIKFVYIDFFRALGGRKF